MGSPSASPLESPSSTSITDSIGDLPIDSGLSEEELMSLSELSQGITMLATLLMNASEAVLSVSEDLPLGLGELPATLSEDIYALSEDLLGVTQGLDAVAAGEELALENFTTSFVELNETFRNITESYSVLEDTIALTSCVVSGDVLCSLSASGDFVWNRIASIFQLVLDRITSIFNTIIGFTS